MDDNSPFDSLNKERETRLSQILDPFFCCLQKDFINYCVCGNYVDLPYKTNNDIDICVDNIDAAIEKLRKICASLNYKIYIHNINANGSNLFIYTNDEMNEIIHIDIMKECRLLSFIPLVSANTILEHRKIYKNFWVTDEIVDAAMHFIYPLSYHFKITPKYYDDIEKAANSTEFWTIVKRAWGTRFTNNIKPLVMSKDWERIEKIYKEKRYLVILGKLKLIELRYLGEIFLLVYTNLLRIARPTGLFIAFIGPDGSGKSTLKNNLSPFFKLGFTKGKIKSYYWRPFLFPRLKKLYNFNYKNDISLNEIDEDPQLRLKLRTCSAIKRFGHSIKLLYYFLDFVFGRILYQGVWSRGGVVCFDRYWHDLEVFPERFGMNVPKCLVRVLSIFVPKPDLVFYLHAEPEVMHARKPELPIDEMKRQIIYYKELCNRYENFHVINGEQSEESVLEDVIYKCLDKMSQRYKK